MGDSMVAAKAAQVRVAILRDADHFTITVDGGYDISDFNSGEHLATGIRIRPSIVTIKGGAIQVGDKFFECQRLLIEPRKEALVSVDAKKYRGSITIIKESARSLSVINSIDLEEYIRGVLYHEISDKWPLEAIKAQAVATRTFAVYSMEKYAERDYDMTSDVYSQVYGGRSAERYRTNLAVKRTKGEVLTYAGKVFPAFFSSNCGGVTEDAREMWGIDIPPLRGNISSPYSIDSPHYKWRQNFRLKDIQDKLNTKGYQIGLIQGIKVAERNESGRVRKLEITDRDGKTLVVEGKLFREIIGPNILKSNNFKVQMKGWYVDISGYGWGHGVGMCQWGALGMAKLRHNYKEILSFYYPSSELTPLKD
jgi:stage II sporulation protein D